MVEPPSQERNPDATRARIIEAALGLFTRQGYRSTTIDQIAAGAGVGRRTVFNHFDSNKAILFDHLELGRRNLVDQLAGRPVDEPPLRSLHLVLRAKAASGFDRELLSQIRSVLEGEADLLPPDQGIGRVAVPAPAGRHLLPDDAADMRAVAAHSDVLEGS